MWRDPNKWEHDGDDWSFHADSCGQPYRDWKQAVVNAFLEPFLSVDVDFLEVAPGHGRWTEFMVGRTRSLTLVDLDADCIGVCRERFGNHAEVEFLVNDGRSVPVADASVDVIWSFGTFVHIGLDDFDAYVADFRRVLRPGGRFIIHHAGWPSGSRERVRRHIERGQGWWFGDRVPMSPEHVVSMAKHHDLDVDEQVRTWGADREWGLAFNDIITIGSVA